MSKLNLITFIICLLMVTSCSSQKERAEDIIMKCLYESYEDNGVEFKQAMVDYENLLIQQEFLKGKSGKNYKEAIGLLIENEGAEYLPSISFNRLLLEVYEIDKLIFFIFLINNLHKVVFPAPEGDEIIINLLFFSILI